MYSRTAISKSLGEQKSLCASLQKMISRQTVDLEESKELVNREVILRKKMEDSVVDKDSEIERLKMKCHHVDQELKRLLAIIEVNLLFNIGISAEILYCLNLYLNFWYIVHGEN